MDFPLYFVKYTNKIEPRARCTFLDVNTSEKMAANQICKTPIVMLRKIPVYLSHTEKFFFFQIVINILL